MEEKWNPTQEAINKALRPNTIRKWLNTIIILVIGIGILVVVIYLGVKKPVNDSSENSLKEKINTENVIVPKTQEFLMQKDLPSNKNEVTEDFSSYVNTSISNSSGNTSISITVVDENGDISSPISSSIANIYNQTGNIGNTGLLRSSFVHKPGFQELLEGNSEIIEKLKLSNHADYIGVGRIKYLFRKGTLVDGTFVCTASLTMSIISSTQKSIAKSFSISENGNGVSESQAQEAAREKLINKYFNEYASF
jgi:hypothetical protein